MVWLLTKASHNASIGGWVRQWLSGSATDRFIQISTPGIVWAIVWGALAYSGDSDTLFLAVGLAPWYFWALDAVVDHLHTNGELSKLMSRDDVVLATRAEYVGGHPLLPHGRFAYVAICGSKANPALRIIFPGLQGTTDADLMTDEALAGRPASVRDDHYFDIPLLDFEKTEPKSEREQSLAETLLASIDERAGGLFKSERVTLNVDYHGLGGRKHRVELTSFFRGNDEIRNWRNYLVCAQAEADTGIKPFGPWKSLKSAPEEVISHAPSGDGSKVPAARRAFDRR